MSKDCPERNLEVVCMLFQRARLAMVTPLRLATLAMVSPLRTLTAVRRVTSVISGENASLPLSAMWVATSVRCWEVRGTIKAEPALIIMRGGMRLTLRKSVSLMPTRCAALATVMVLGATHTVQLAYWPSW